MDIAYRFPLMPAVAQSRVRWIEEHPHAPAFTHPGVDRVTPAGLAAVAAYAERLRVAPPRWMPDQPPAWLPGYVAACLAAVPFYRAYADSGPAFTDLPTCDRADLARAPWRFVPDDQPLTDLIVYNTSGTTGHPLSIPTHPDSLAHYVPLLQAALRAHGIELSVAAGPVAVLQVCWQRRTYTMAGALAALDWAPFAKINLNAADWRDPSDRALFIDACAAPILTGDPLAFAELARLPVRITPQALVSTALSLSAGLQAELAARFGCPVLNIYSLNEAGPVAVAEAHADRWRPLQDMLYVELLDATGQPCPPGVRGEITLTGGFNRLLPLLRYRTGDQATWATHVGEAFLTDLSGRPPVVFTGADGRRINNVDVSNALRPYPIGQFTLRQTAEGALTLRVWRAAVDEATLRHALAELFGPDLTLRVAWEGPEAPVGEGVQYACE